MGVESDGLSPGYFGSMGMSTENHFDRIICFRLRIL